MFESGPGWALVETGWALQNKKGHLRDRVHKAQTGPTRFIFYLKIFSN